MNKKFLLLIIFVLVICGCSKKETLTCTLEDSTNTNVKIESKSVIKFKDGYLTEYVTNQSLEFTDEDSAKEYYDNFESDEEYNIKIEGRKVIFDYSKIIDDTNKVEENTKEYLKNYLESKNYKCK